MIRKSSKSPLACKRSVNAFLLLICGKKSLLRASLQGYSDVQYFYPAFSTSEICKGFCLVSRSLSDKKRQCSHNDEFALCSRWESFTAGLIHSGCQSGPDNYCRGPQFRCTPSLGAEPPREAFIQGSTVANSTSNPAIKSGCSSLCLIRTPFLGDCAGSFYL